jgi:predicted peroxiredoxin
MLQKTLQMGKEIDVCVRARARAKRMLGWDKVNLIPGVTIVGAATLNDLALNAAPTM